MLEKDIENLLAMYPNEFFPFYTLRLEGQQVKLGTYIADIVFENEKGETLVVEVKRGILPREAISQVIDYYGMIKEIDPNKNILLILAANVIPKERTIFLAEKLGIKFVEVSRSKILDVARKYSYKFLDSEEPRILDEYKKTTRRLDEKVSMEESRVWMFQANPRRYDIWNALDDEKMDKEGYWMVNQYKNEIRSGHIGLIWMSGKEGGICALVDIVSNPEYLIDDPDLAKYWMSSEDKGQRRLRVKIRMTLKLKNNPITKEELRNISGLRNMKIFRQPQGTNFPVSSNEWELISSLVKKRLDSSA